MKKNIIVILFFLISCVSTAKIDMLPRNKLIEISKKQKLPYKQILVKWINYPYSDFHKVNYLEKNIEDIKAVEVDENDYKKLKSKIIKEFREAGLYDEENGTGTVKILLTSYGRWSYSELFSTYLIDTGYVLILPSSLNVSYKMSVKAQQNFKEIKFDKEASIKTTFFFLLFPLYPFSTFSGKEKTIINNLIYQIEDEICKNQLAVI